MLKKKIIIFTGNRAEYGLQLPIFKELSKNKHFNCKLLVSGSHMDKKFGFFLNDIKKDKIKISEKIKLSKINENKVNYTPLKISDGIIKFSKYFLKEKPDIVLINADRYETFAASLASSQMGIATYHIEGGDVTSGGVFDDNVRHAITKLSHIHFCTNKFSFKNLLKLNEEKWRIFNVGLTINDHIYSLKKPNIKILEKKLNISFDKPLIIFTLHPISSDVRETKKTIKVCLKVLLILEKKYNCNVIITYPNNDFGAKIVINEILKIKNKNIKVIKNLTNKILHSILYFSNKKKIVVMGNSSMGIKEAIAFKTPVINIGSRQNGRLKPQNVINVNLTQNNILKMTKFALFNPKFRNKCLKFKNPYFIKNTAKKISTIINKIKINKKLFNKKFL